MDRPGVEGLVRDYLFLTWKHADGTPIEIQYIDIDSGNLGNYGLCMWRPPDAEPDPVTFYRRYIQIGHGKWAQFIEVSDRWKMYLISPDPILRQQAAQEIYKATHDAVMKYLSPVGMMVEYIYRVIADA